MERPQLAFSRRTAGTKTIGECLMISRETHAESYSRLRSKIFHNITRCHLDKAGCRFDKNTRCRFNAGNMVSFLKSGGTHRVVGGDLLMYNTCCRRARNSRGCRWHQSTMYRHRCVGDGNSKQHVCRSTVSSITHCRIRACR